MGCCKVIPFRDVIESKAGMSDGTLAKQKSNLTSEYKRSGIRGVTAWHVRTIRNSANGIVFWGDEWALRDLNPRPADYESDGFPGIRSVPGCFCVPGSVRVGLIPGLNQVEKEKSDRRNS